MKNRILYFMYLNNITQKDLANRLGISERTLHRYIIGEVKPQIDIAMQLADEIGAGTVYEVFDYKNTLQAEINCNFI